MRFDGIIKGVCVDGETLWGLILEPPMPDGQGEKEQPPQEAGKKQTVQIGGKSEDRGILQAKGRKCSGGQEVISSIKSCWYPLLCFVFSP